MFRKMVRLASLAGLMVLALLIAATGLGARSPCPFRAASEALRTVLAAAFGRCARRALIALALHRWRWRALAAYLRAVPRRAGVVVRSCEPSQRPRLAARRGTLPYATIDGDIVTVHNIRNFDYRTETDFTPAYYDKSFDLRKLDGVDLVAVYWMGPHIAHIIVSFGFAGGDHLAISIETRKEKGEGYSTIKGFFRQYELYYVVADERDVIGLRTNYRQDPPEDVYVYRVKGTPEDGRRLFLEYISQINALRSSPSSTTSLTTNCTTNIWMHTPRQRRAPALQLEDPRQRPCAGIPVRERPPGSTGGLPFAELQRRAHVNARAQGGGQRRTSRNASAEPD